MGAGDGGLDAAEIGQSGDDLDDRPARGDLIVEDDGLLARDVTDHRRDHHLVVGEALFVAGSHWKSKEPRQQRRLFGVAEVRGHDDVVAEVASAVVVGDDAKCREMIHRHGEEPVDLRGVEVHRQHPVDAGGDQQVGDEAASQGDAGCVLLVGTGVGVVRDHRRDLRRRRASGRVDHQQQFHQMLLGGRHERLHDVDVALPAVGKQLGLKAVVAEPGDLHMAPGNLQMVTDLISQRMMGGTGENDDALHGLSLLDGCMSPP